MRIATASRPRGGRAHRDFVARGAVGGFDRRRGDTCACWRGMSRGLECNRDRAFALGGGGVGLVALLLAAVCLVALLLVALFPATDLPPSETYLLYVYCVLVVRAWTYEYGLNQMYVGGFFTGNRPPVFPLGGLQSLLCITNGVKFLGRLKSLLYDSLHDTCCTHDTCASGALFMIHSQRSLPQ